MISSLKVFFLKQVVEHSKNIASFISALYSQNERMALLHLSDIIAEPARKDLLPNYDKVKQGAFDLGAGGVGISGSGPTIFSACHNIDIASKTAEYFKQHYLQNDQGFVSICRLDLQGARIVQSKPLSSNLSNPEPSNSNSSRGSM